MQPDYARTVVIIGAGLAGARTAASLRDQGFRGRISVLGKEGIAPYDRPPLSKELLTQIHPMWLSADIGLEIADVADEVHLGDQARSLVNIENQWKVVTASGKEFLADDVVLAMGAQPRHPATWDALVLHTAADADRLRRELRPGTDLVIIGAGWIGAEIAGVARSQAGVNVTVVEAGPHPLHRQLGAAGAHMARWYADAGVDLRVGVTVVRTGTRGGAERRAVERRGIELSDGTAIDADVVLAATGVTPATDWLGDQVPLNSQGFAVTDSWGRVLAGPLAQQTCGSVSPGLWAVGDCATRFHDRFGWVPGGHWSAALHDPEVTGWALTHRGWASVAPVPSSPSAAPTTWPAPGTAPHSAPVPSTAPRLAAPYVFSRQLGHDVALFGVPAPGQHVTFCGNPQGSSGWAAVYSDAPPGLEPPTVRAVLLVDSPRDTGRVRKLMNAEQLPCLDTTGTGPSTPGRSTPGRSTPLTQMLQPGHPG